MLCAVDRESGARTTVAELPGYARGLAFAGRFAFVGLSQIRQKDVFGGMPIADRYDDANRKCGISVVAIDSGQVASSLYFKAGCTEIFDIQVLPGLQWPGVIGFEGQTLDGIMIAPPGTWDA